VSIYLGPDIIGTCEQKTRPHILAKPIITAQIKVLVLTNVCKKLPDKRRTFYHNRFFRNTQVSNFFFIDWFFIPSIRFKGVSRGRGKL